MSTSHFASYDVNTSSWQSLPDGLFDVSGHTSHVIRDTVYVFYGQSSASGFVSVIQSYSLGRYTVYAICSLLLGGRRANDLLYSAMLCK